jgi:hypothetical protein
MTMVTLQPFVAAYCSEANRAFCVAAQVKLTVGRNAADDDNTASAPVGLRDEDDMATGKVMV